MESAPAVTPPNPTTTAAAQTASNQATAITQQELNQTNQVGPTGTSTYQQTGTNADGTPQFTQTTALSAPQQAIFNTGQTSEGNLANAAESLTSQEATQLATPFNVDNAVSQKIDSIGKQTLDPQWAANDSAQAATLANEGVTPGSEAYNNAMVSYNQGKNNAYNSLYLSGDAQAESEALANQNETTNQISALMSGSQVGTPTFSSTPQTSVAGTDVAGITQNSYADANQQAQQSVAANNSMMGGLFSLAGTAATAGIKYSDRRLKRNVALIGRDSDGFNRYAFQYVWGGPFETGVMAQEVRATRPDAVSADKDGFLMVDYSRLGRAA
jgi:hypothetical protein